MKYRCQSRNISRDKIESLVLKTTVDILRSPEAIKMIAQQVANLQEIDPTADEQARIKKERNSIQSKLHKGHRKRLMLHHDYSKHRKI